MEASSSGLPYSVVITGGMMGRAKTLTEGELSAIAGAAGLIIASVAKPKARAQILLEPAGMVIIPALGAKQAELRSAAKMPAAVSKCRRRARAGPMRRMAT